MNDKHYGKIVFQNVESTIIECEVCGFKHIYPFPKMQEINKLYSEEYYEAVQSQYIQKIEEDKEWWLEVYEDRVDKIKKYLANTEDVKVLDIGSGPGYFLSAAANFNWHAFGMEPSMQAYLYSKALGHSVVNQFFNDETASDIYDLDVVHMNHVLEHIPNAKNTINLIWEKLKVGGILCVAVPNDFNVFQNILHEKYNYKPWWISPKEHINYFNFESLGKLLENKGFEILEQSTSFPMELFLMMDDNYIENSSLGRECHFKRKKFEMKLFENNLKEIRNKFYESLADNGLGRDVIIFARKINK